MRVQKTAPDLQVTSVKFTSFTVAYHKVWAITYAVDSDYLCQQHEQFDE